MFCYDCHSDNVSESSSDGAEVWYECHECGLIFDAACDDDGVWDECYASGHDWKEVTYPNGEAYGICRTCGLIDA